MSLMLLVGLGCSDITLKSLDDPPDPGLGDRAPVLRTDPTEIDFGMLQVGDRDSMTVPVRVFNDGDADLLIADISLSEVDAPYDLGRLGSVLIPPGGESEFTVTFTPETAVESAASVWIDSNDPMQPVAEIPVVGQGIAPIVAVSPEEYDFGTLYVGCEALLPVGVSNVGNDTLFVDDLVYSTGSTDMTFDPDLAGNGELSWELEPGEAVEVWVDYAPLDEYQDVAYLQVFTNDPVQPQARATQNGSGALAGTNTDLFEQPINGQTDILFAVDWSGSMYEDVANVEANFGTFVTTLAAMDASYHVAVVTEDDGCVNYPAGTQPWIDDTMSVSDQTAVFETMLCEQYSGASCDSHGSNTERAFMLLEAGLKNSNITTGGCNDGFYREDASLSLVGVSDEPEQSVNPYTYYVALFQGMKEDPDDVVMHAIGGDYPGGCGGNQAYTGFYEATVATGGLFLSICATDFGSHLEALAEGSAADLTTFELSDIPVPETLEVTVNGIPTSVGWSYNAIDNSIEFEEDLTPEGGSTIQVDYALYGDCEG